MSYPKPHYASPLTAAEIRIGVGLKARPSRDALRWAAAGIAAMNETVTCTCGRRFKKPQTLWDHFVKVQHDAEKTK